ncbi:hypothetical protein ACQ4PT_049412 [Festuca glaucescens]
MHCVGSSVVHVRPVGTSSATVHVSQPVHDAAKADDLAAGDQALLAFEARLALQMTKTDKTISSLRTHACMDPFIIFKLLKLHMRYTLKINALARQILIYGDDVIESGGMAVEDASHPHGLRLLIEDYPYATKGLLLWSAIFRWCEAYVAAYYPSDEAVRADYELQLI